MRFWKGFVGIVILGILTKDHLRRYLKYLTSTYKTLNTKPLNTLPNSSEKTNSLAKNSFEFAWNVASDSDWHYIERNFIAAYFNAYKDEKLIDLAISTPILNKAKKLWDYAYKKACQGDCKPLYKNIFRPLAPLLSHIYKKSDPERDTLSHEKELLDTHFRTQKDSDISTTREYLIKLTALRLYFKEEYEVEKNKILMQAKHTHQRIHYLIARYQEQPIAFFSCELNYKSGRIYMRWVTLSPTFQRLGLGKIMFEVVNKHFPDNTGIELYTRLANHSAQHFYKKIGFLPTTNFDFSEPALTNLLKPQPGYFASFTNRWLSQDATCCAPADESVPQTENFMGFIRKKLPTSKGMKIRP